MYLNEIILTYYMYLDDTDTQIQTNVGIGNVSN